jgi:cytochrome P450
VPGSGRFPVGEAITLADLDRDPHPWLARLRDTEPVSWLPALNGWFVTRHDLAVAVMRDSAAFTVDDPRFSTARVVGPSMLSLDGAEHGRHRAPFTRGFSRGEIHARLAAFVTAEADRLVAVMRPAGAADARLSLAGPLAVAVVAEALGLGDADPATVLGWYAAIVGSVSALTGDHGQATPGQAGIAGGGSREAGAPGAGDADVGAARAGAAGAGVADGGAAGAGAAGADVVEAGAAGSGVADVGAARAGAAGAGVADRRTAGSGAVEVGAVEVGAVEVGAAGGGAAEVGAGAAAFESLSARLAAVIDATDGPPSLLADAAGARGGAAATGLSTPEAISNAAVLMFGGIETTEGMIGNAILHLLSNPDQLALVRADDGLVPNAIEESLRLEPAAAVVDRYATRDIQVAGAAIRRGDLVTVSLAGAGRDPAVFTDPNAFDVRRHNARLNLAFAHGPHFCLGAHLARLEAQAAVRAVLGLPGLRLDPDRPTAPRGLVFRKPPSLHLQWTV